MRREAARDARGSQGEERCVGHGVEEAVLCWAVTDSVDCGYCKQPRRNLGSVTPNWLLQVCCEGVNTAANVRFYEVIIKKENDASQHKAKATCL